MRNGNLLKEKLEFQRERFKTRQGLADFLVGTAIWGFLISEYKDAVLGYFMELFGGVGNEFIQMYLSFLGLGIVFTVVGLVVSFGIVTIFKEIVEK